MANVVRCLGTRALCALLFLLAACAAPADLGAGEPPAASLRTQAKLPSGFRDALVTNVSKPTALAFTPDGRLLITTQPGKLLVYKNGTLRTAYTMRNLCTDSERGLLGVAVDPQFARNRFVYLYYTLNKSGRCARNSPSSPVNRVSRFTLSSTNKLSPSSRVTLIDNIPSPNGNHNGGDLHFGKDGLLYVSVGDGGCDYQGRGGCGARNDAARGKHTLVGKILRITRTGGVPSGNPFKGSNSVRCNVSGRARPGRACREVYALGLRNPFRMAFDPNASGTRFFINDVGQHAREEIDLGRRGADYGWNLREGRCRTGGSDCGDSRFADPLFDYAHAPNGQFSGCRSISGGAFVPSGAWPSLRGSYLFSDFICGKIFKLTKTRRGYVASTFASGLGSGSAVHLSFGPDGGGQALYYTSYTNGGQVRRIRYGN